jgi:hypothetical protein
MVLHLETPHGLRSKETDFLLDEVLKAIPVVLEEPTTGTKFVNEGGGTFVARPEEDLLLESNLMDLFPGMLSDVRLVREDDEDGRRR